MDFRPHSFLSVQFSAWPWPCRACSGFTLVELMIAVVILGILSAVAVPNFGSPVRDSKEAALLFDLVAIRTALERFKAQHDQTYPVVFAAQLTIATDKAGLPGTTYAPYLPHGFPRNPISGDANVREVVTMPDAPDDSTGWIYALTTGEFRANVSGTAPSGKYYFDQ